MLAVVWIFEVLAVHHEGDGLAVVIGCGEGGCTAHHRGREYSTVNAVLDAATHQNLLWLSHASRVLRFGHGTVTSQFAPTTNPASR